MCAYERNVAFFEIASVLDFNANRAFSVEKIRDVLVVYEFAQSVDFSVLFGKRNRLVHRTFHTVAKSCVFGKNNLQFTPRKTMPDF